MRTTAGLNGVTKNPAPQPNRPERGTAGVNGMIDDEDPSIIPEDIKEFVKQAHKERQESRPDESWRITPSPKPDAVDAPYKLDEEDMEEKPDVLEQLKSMGMNFDAGGIIPDDSVGEGDGNHGEGPFTSGAPQDGPQPIDLASIPPPIQNMPLPAPKAPMAAPAAPELTDQTYMDRANKLLGLNPQDQAGFMKLLGDRSQKAQIGAGIAGIGDAIASGGTLGKVNPGALNKSEDIINNKEKSGIEGMQTIRGNQEKASEMADKLQLRDPNSPLSKYAQKTYGQLGKKIGLDLSHAPASLIADVTGKGVEALNTEFQGQLKMMGLNLQKQQVEATTANQRAEREQANKEDARKADEEAAKHGILHPFKAAEANARLAEGSSGTSFSPDVVAYAQKHGITPQQAQEQKNRRGGK